MTTVLDLLGIACIAAFAVVVWWPATFLVIGTAALLASWRASP